MANKLVINRPIMSHESHSCISVILQNCRELHFYHEWQFTREQNNIFNRFLVTYAQMNALFSPSALNFSQFCLKNRIFKDFKGLATIRWDYFFLLHGSYGYSKEAYLAHGFNAKNLN